MPFTYCLHAIYLLLTGRTPKSLAEMSLVRSCAVSSRLTRYAWLGLAAQSAFPLTTDPNPYRSPNPSPNPTPNPNPNPNPKPNPTPNPNPSPNPNQVRLRVRPGGSRHHVITTGQALNARRLVKRAVLAAAEPGRRTQPVRLEARSWTPGQSCSRFGPAVQSCSLC